ncbi:MAG: Rne/Rng family ribonuclease [Propionicimonas sp.]|uniref:Rne/Rng family ribonuclease n=1 Tax=Propionicimonas sp. TaxID=1955623 RepID=UPI003D0FA10A
MLDSEHPDTDQSAQDGADATPAQPPRRRRAASRPAGPPAAVEAPAAEPEASVPAGNAPAPETTPVQTVDAPAAEAVPEPAATPKRPRRSRKAAEPVVEAPAEAASDPVVADFPAVAEAPAEVPVAAEPATTPRRRRATRAAAAPDAPAAGDGEVAASLAELAQSGRGTSRRTPKSETFGLAQEASPDEVLNSLAAVIGGRLAEGVDAEATEDEEADAEAEATEEELAEDEAAEDEATDDDSDDEGAEAAEGEDGSPRRRRRRRGGRRRRRGAGEPTADAEGDSDAEGEGESAEDADAPAAEEEGTDGPAAEGTASRRRRRRRRRTADDASEADDDSVEVVVRVREPRRRSTASDEVTGIEGSTRMEAKKQRRREGRAAGRRRTPILSESEFLARREAVERIMLVRQADDYSQIAVMEDGVLVEHYVDRASATSMIGNIYLGRIQNVLPSMEAAFVDIGRGRNAVLYAGEVDWESFGVTGADKKVERVFKSGQQVLVQVSKDPVGAKGARLTSHISIPGRYIVYSPGGHLSGISRKLPEGERRRLKSILDELIGSEASVIVRTAAEGASEDELVRDVNRLKAQWEVLEKKVKAGQAPQQLYAEPDLTVRIVRDLFTEDFGALIVDGNGGAEDTYDTVDAYVQHVAPHLAERLQRWDRTASGDIFEAYRVHEQVAKALERKVFLPSGGSLIIDRTEAMTVIDVNTGKFTGTSGNLEATVTSNNLEAAEEIVRQLRLRDIGGIIVIDFIDMVLPANRELLLRRLVECLGRDRTRHQVAEVTSLGLVQMTRKKIGTGLAEAFTVACETCHGRGYHVHDAPVASQAPADGGDRDGSRRGRGGAQTTRRAPRGRREDPKPAAPSPVLLAAHAHEHAHHVDAPELPLPEPADELAQAVAALLAPDPVPELAPAEDSVVVEAVVVEEPVVVEVDAPADAVVVVEEPAE